MLYMYLGIAYTQGTHVNGELTLIPADIVQCYFVQTTLLNHILTADHGKRIAVIENEVLFSSTDGVNFSV